MFPFILIFTNICCHIFTLVFLIALSWYLILVLICIYFIISDVEHFLIVMLLSAYLLWKQCLYMLSAIFQSRSFLFFFQCGAIWVLWMRWGKIIQFNFSHVIVQFSWHLLQKRLSSSQCISLPFLSNIYWLYKSEFTSGLFILFHSSMCLFCVSTIVYWLLNLCTIV